MEVVQSNVTVEAVKKEDNTDSVEKSHVEAVIKKITVCYYLKQLQMQLMQISVTSKKYTSN